MSRPRVLIAHPYLNPCGGGNVVAAWTLQALRDDYDVTLVTLMPVDCGALNRNFGTSLRERDFTVRLAPAFWRSLIRYSPTGGVLLQDSVTMRWAQDLDRKNPFDALMSTRNEADLGRPGLQYVHYPWTFKPSVSDAMRWFHLIPGVLHGYRTFCRRVARTSDERMRRSLSLANSEFVAGRIKEIHGVEAKTLHPPVPGGFPHVPWEARMNGVVCVGRMHGCKRWEMAVDIVERIRSQGMTTTLTLISHRDDPEYAGRMEALAVTRPWMRILFDLPRERMVEEVARHRYGLHTAEYEHFGIAPAELLRAGCLTFVHRSGGPMEIVGHREELLFTDAAGACDRICRVLRDDALERDLRQFAQQRGECYSENRFCDELRGFVEAMVSQSRRERAGTRHRA